MKKIIILLISLSLILLMVGCDTSDSGNENLNENLDKNAPESSGLKGKGITVNAIEFEVVDPSTLTQDIKEQIEKNKIKQGYDYFRDSETGEITLVVYLGQRSSAGYSTEVVSVTDNEGVTDVTVIENGPKKGDMVAEVLTFPYTVVKFSGTTDNININWLLPNQDDNTLEDKDAGVVEDPDQPVTQVLYVTVVAEYVGMVDNNSIELKLEDGLFKVFRIPDEIKEEVTQYTEGDTVKLEYYKNENQQFVITNIDRKEK